MDLSMIKVKIGSKEIGKEPSLLEVINIIKKYDRINLIGVLSSINLSICCLGDENDKELRRRFLSPAINNKLKEFEKGVTTESIVFSRQPILILMEMSIVYGKKEETEGILYEDIGLAVIIINSFIAKVENYISDKKESGNIDKYADFAMKQYIFNTSHQMRYAMPRSFMMYQGIRKEVKEHYKYIDIDSLFLKKRKFNFTNYFDILIVLYSVYGNFKIENLDKGLYIIKSKIFNGISDETKYLEVLENISIDLETYQPQIPKEDDLESWFSYMYKFYSFRLKPLMKFSLQGQTLYACTDLQFIINSFWDGPYNVVLTDHKGNDKLIEDFFGFLGDTLELYFQKISSYTFKNQFSLVELKNKNPLNDGVIKIDTNWEVIIETKAARPTQEMTSGLNPIEEISDFDKLVLNGMEQLNERIKEYRLEGYKGRITPILITSGFVPLDSLIWSRFYKKLQHLEIFQNKISDHPLLLDIESWEVICANKLHRNDFENLINKKLSTPEKIEQSPHDFLYAYYFNGNEPKFSELLTLHADLWNRAVYNLFKKAGNVKEAGVKWDTIFTSIKL